jgi:antitoxin component YwqK of YwqJK toxin-antitoxin module
VTALLALLLLAGPGPLACPAGATLAGAAPPDGFEDWCELRDELGRALRHGPQRTFYDDGAPSGLFSWTRGVSDGPFVEFHRNGRKAREGRTRDGLKEGLWQLWFEDGRLEEEVHYQDGQLDGPYRSYWVGGQRRVEGRYCHGVQCGRWISWGEDGRELGRIDHEEQRDRP